MINLNKQLCDELGITFWQLRKESDNNKVSHHISQEEKELLRNILLAKGIQIQAKDCIIEERGVVKLAVGKYILEFNDANQTDTDTHINLAKLSDMQNNQQLKKITWFKLKNLNL